MGHGFRSLTLSVLALIVLAPSFPVVAKDEGAARVRVTSVGDLYAAGGNVEIGEPVPGDAFIAGGRVRVDSAVSGDAFLSGGHVVTRGRIGETLFAAAGTLSVEGEIARNLRAAGGDVIIGREASIGGKVMLAGGHVDISGKVGRYLTVAAESVRVDGTINGDADISARSIEIGPRAVVNGKLTYWSPGEASIDPAAKLAVPSEHRAMHVPEGMHTAGIVAMMIGGFFLLIGFMVLGSLFVLLFPNFTGVVERTFASNPGKSFLLGAALFLLLPLVGILFFITILGIPIALAVFFLYPLVLLIGYLTAAIFIGDRGMSLVRKGRELTTGVRIIGVIAALLLLALLRAVPFIGTALVFVLLLMGLGSWVIALYRRYHAPPVAGAT
jgi:cytoskeletal protein CcmA (bactofilin family)